MTAADRFIAESEIEPHYQEITARVARSSVLLARGDLDGADADTRLALALARQAKDPQTLVPAIVSRVAGRDDPGSRRPGGRAADRGQSAAATVGWTRLVLTSGRGGWPTPAGLSTRLPRSLDRDHTVRPRRERPRRWGSRSAPRTCSRRWRHVRTRRTSRLLAAEREIAVRRPRRGRAAARARARLLPRGPRDLVHRALRGPVGRRSAREG